MGDFVKLYEGSFCEAGNFGKESVLVKNIWHPRVVYLEKYGIYLMSGTRWDDGNNRSSCETVLRTSEDLVHWSEPLDAPTVDGKVFGNHYVAVRPISDNCHASVIPEDEFLFLTNHNATDVKKFRTKIVAT